MYTSCFLSDPSNLHILNTEYSQEICLPTFVVDDFSRLLQLPF